MLHAHYGWQASSVLYFSCALADWQVIELIGCFLCEKKKIDRGGDRSGDRGDAAGALRHHRIRVHHLARQIPRHPVSK